MASPLRESLVDLIFGKCSLVYGRDWPAKWEGLNLAEVKADWTRELGALLQRPDAIRYALENLPPDRPPNVLQFRAICINAPRTSTQKAAPAIEPTPEQAEAAKKVKDMAVAKLKLMGSRRSA